MASTQLDQIQALILQTLDRDGSISDTRELELNGSKLASTEDQGAIKSVLDSLMSKEVSPALWANVVTLARAELEQRTKGRTLGGRRIEADEIDDCSKTNHDDIVHPNRGRVGYRGQRIPRV